MDRFRWAANLSTLANGLVGLGAILYTLAGNKLWAMLLIVCGIGFDGLDGMFSRRSRARPGSFGRVADSVADAVTFGVAPATLIAVHTDHAQLWAGASGACEAVAALVAVLAVARLVYFTLRGFQRDHFIGAPTPQTALAIVLLGLLFDRPAFAGTNPTALLIGSALFAVLMVVPIGFPKIRRGSRLRPIATGTAIALVAALVPLQFSPSAGSLLYLLALAAVLASAVGVALYYLVGAFTVGRAAEVPS